MFDIKKIRERAKKLLDTKRRSASMQSDGWDVRSKERDIGSSIEEMALKHETRLSESVSTEDIYAETDLFTVKEAAVFLGCAPATVRGYISRGSKQKLPIIRVGEKGRSIRIQREALEKFQKRRYQRPVQVTPTKKGINTFPVMSPHLPKLLALLEKDPDYTLEELGEECGVTRERIRQILKRHNVSKSYGSRNRRKKQDYVVLHIENNVKISHIGSNSGIEETDIPNFFNEKHEKFLGLPLEQIEIVTAYITLASKIVPSGKYGLSPRSKGKHCQPDHPVLCFKNPKLGQNWRCYVCKPLYPWDYINKDGVILKKEKTQPCNNCGKDVTHRAAILWRQEKDERYKGHFYCNRECFYTFRNKMRWWEASPIYQGIYWKERELFTRTCVVCDKEFQTPYLRTLMCSTECKRERTIRVAQAKRKENLQNSNNNIVRELQNLGIDVKEIANYLGCETHTVYSWSCGGSPSPKNTIRLKRLLQLAKNLTT